MLLSIVHCGCNYLMLVLHLRLSTATFSKIMLAFVELH